MKLAMLWGALRLVAALVLPLGPLIAGGVYVFGGQFLWVFTAIAALGVLLYLYAFTGHTTEAEDARECESQIKGTNTGINDWVSFTKLFFVIASRSILFSVLSIFIPILYITVINGEAGASSLALTMYFAMGQFSPIWVVHYQIS